MTELATQNHSKPSQLKSYFNGLIVAIIILAVFFFGALADRLFVIKPLDFIVARSGNLVAQTPITNVNSPLRELLESGRDVSVADISEVASQSVVTVAVERQQQVLSPSRFGLFNFQVPTGEIEEIQQDIGTGFVADESGLVVTNKHVVSDAAVKYLIIDKEGNEHDVTNIYRDPANDLAILQVADLSAPPLALGNSEQIRVGEPVIAIGTALGEFRHTVTTGVISGLGRGIEAASNPFEATETLEGVIQTDAAINPGNSGGPLLDAAGEVIGVNVAVSAGAENIGFAIPINVIKASLDNFNQTGQFDRPFLGIRYQIISQEAALANDLPVGALLHEVVADSVADQAGLESGDIITKLAGQEINTENDLATEINKQNIGKEVEIEYWRDGQSNTVNVTLQKAVQE
jgi:S1-C subfamily serine protease